MLRIFFKAKKIKKTRLAILLACLAIFYSDSVFAVKTHGRFTFGTFASTERFTETTFGSDKNDRLISSARLFYKVSDVGQDRWEFITDLRDKHDFFDKLDKEKLELSDRNDFQTRQLLARWVNPAGSWSSSLGRFQLPEAGAIFVDGAELEYRSGSQWRWGAFAGLNPRNLETSYVQTNVDANQYGLFSTFQSHQKGWDKNFYATHSLVQQSFKSQTERRFFYHNMIYQWEEPSRFISTLYLDTYPSTKVQTGHIIYQQGLGPKWSTEFSALTIDVVEYARRAGILERLEPSPYREAQHHSSFLLNASHSVFYRILGGQRDYDDLQKSEFKLGWQGRGFLKSRVDLFFLAGHRDNFTSNDSFASVGGGYYSRVWELTGSAIYEIRKNDDTTLTHPLILELAYTRFISKTLFGTFSVEHTSDETVQIQSAFFKVGYRFGSQEVPPIRDGAPPRSQL